MIHVYQKREAKNGETLWSKEGQTYFIQAINNAELNQYLADGWYRSLDEALDGALSDEIEKRAKQEWDTPKERAKSIFDKMILEVDSKSERKDWLAANNIPIDIDGRTSDQKLVEALEVHFNENVATNN